MKNLVAHGCLETRIDGSHVLAWCIDSGERSIFCVRDVGSGGTDAVLEVACISSADGRTVRV